MMDALDRLTAALADRYRIERELGQGGMARVFLAEDVKHKRKVALKVLKPELAAVLGAERFVHEITTTAALQHPHILPLFDSGTADGFLYYVMPFIDGETLRAKLDRETQLGVDEAVRIAREVADALDYAHNHGVIHRDIKPENILLANGRPMVADFGIALAVSAAAGGRMTETGLSLGTPHYMSPEQATAEKEITGRSDVYSLASVLYEMLTGEPPHMGNSAQQIIMKIITEPAQPVTRLRKSVPPNVADAVAKALEKLPADRFASAAAFSAALGDPNATNLRTRSLPAARSARRQWLVSGVLAAATLVLGLALGRELRGGAQSGQVARVSISFGDSTVVRAIGNLRLAMSRAGDRVVFVGNDGPDEALWLRDLSQPAARMLPDTKGAFAPFFSPDGNSIGFFTANRGALRMQVLSLTGGGVRTVLADSVASFGGADWADDGQIYFTSAGLGVSRIAATGGPVTHISHPDSTKGHREHDYPDVLPGSKLAVVTIWTGVVSNNRIGVIDLATGAITDLGEGSFMRYVEPGYLAIGRTDGRVMLASFDASKGRLTSAPVSVLEGVQGEGDNGTLQFAVSASGSLVFQPTTNDRKSLVWVNRSGASERVDSAVESSTPSVAISPDGRSIALQIGEQIWIKQLATGALTRVSFGVTSADRPVWSSDGKSVLFIAERGGKRLAWRRRADGSDTTHAAVPGQTLLDEIGVDPRGRYTLLRSEGSGPGTRKLLVLENGVDTAPRSLLASEFDHFAMTLSPDGRWLALVSMESGTPEVHVRPFPDVGSARFVVSVGGGVEPVWRRDGKELFFRNTRNEMYAVSVTTGATFTHGSPTRLFAGPGLAIQRYYRGYDVHPDGKRFLMVSTGGTDARRLEMIINWREQFRQLQISPP